MIRGLAHEATRETGVELPEEEVHPDLMTTKVKGQARKPAPRISARVDYYSQGFFHLAPADPTSPDPPPKRGYFYPSSHLDFNVRVVSPDADFTP